MFIGLLNYEYTIIVNFFVIVGSVIGLTQINRIVKLTGRQSYIVFILSLVLGLALVTIPIKYIFGL
jgi:hypothetical protein